MFRVCRYYTALCKLRLISLCSAFYVSCQCDTACIAAERRAVARLLLTAGRAAIDRYLLPDMRTAANPPQRRANDATATDGRLTIT